MSPILKRDISEQLRQARRLASVIVGEAPDDPPLFEHDYSLSTRQAEHDRHPFPFRTSSSDLKPPDTSTETFASGSSARQGIGVGPSEDTVVGGSWRWRETLGVPTPTPAAEAQHVLGEAEDNSEDGSDLDLVGEERRTLLLRGADAAAGGMMAGERIGRAVGSGEGVGVLDPDGEMDMGSQVYAQARRTSLGAGRRMSQRIQLEYAEAEVPRAGISAGREFVNLLLECTPSLLFSLVGLVFTGELLEHLARWRVFRRVDELFILVPMIGNLKGNLEMCLSARLGTSANIGELDHRRTRQALVLANLTLLGLQALLISCLAAVLSFLLGLLTTHRLGDITPPGADSSAPTPDAGLAVGEQEWHEGYTRPGWKQLVMVLATGMGAAGLSSAVLGSFMGSLIVLSRWAGIDPDNVTPPIAACLGDLLTLFILALLGSALVGMMDTALPLVAVIVMSVAAGWFTRRVMRNEWVKNVAKGGWIPLIGAMLISSGTGMVLDKGVAKYRGFALLAISMTGLTGSIGAIHANRLSTSLHTALKAAPSTSSPDAAQFSQRGLTPLQSGFTLTFLAFPCQAAFLLFVSWAGWIDLSLGWAGWLTFSITTIVSIISAHYMTLFFWSKDLDPDSYTLPIHSALVDFLGQLFLVVAYEICISQGGDVLVKDVAA